MRITSTNNPQEGCPVRLFRNGRTQSLTIPCELELPGDEAIIHKEGERLIVEPIKKRNLAALLASWEPLDEEFPEIEDLPADDGVDW